MLQPLLSHGDAMKVIAASAFLELRTLRPRKAKELTQIRTATKKGIQSQFQPKGLGFSSVS